MVAKQDLQIVARFTMARVNVQDLTQRCLGCVKVFPLLQPGMA